MAPLQITGPCSSSSLSERENNKNKKSNDVISFPFIHIFSSYSLEIFSQPHVGKRKNKHHMVFKRYHSDSAVLFVTIHLTAQKNFLFLFSWPMLRSCRLMTTFFKKLVRLHILSRLLFSIASCPFFWWTAGGFEKIWPTDRRSLSVSERVLHGPAS